METATAIAATAASLMQAVGRVAPVIREYAAANERDRTLAPPVVDAMKAAGLFRMWTPRAFGGHELEPVSVMQVIEEVARLDSAAGWNLQLSTGIVPFFAWFPDDGVEEVWRESPDPIFGGTLFPPGRAIPVDGGYRVSGRWPFVSGCHNASWFMGPALIMDGHDRPRCGDDGNPVQIIIVYRAAEAEILDTWHTVGMRGTGSHDVTAKDVFVPGRRTAVLAPLEKPARGFEGPLYRLTIWTAVAALAAPALGIARAAIDALIDLGGRKTPNYMRSALRERPVVQSQAAQAEALLGAARAYLHASLREAWDGAAREEAVSLEQKIRIQLATSFAMQAAAQAVDLVHAAAGTSGIRLEQPFEKYFRDVHVLTQHAFASANRYESAGKLLFRLPTDWPFFAL
jgi:alkylation response protein AidB-like acyl-CoA dehydrogenase